MRVTIRDRMRAVISRLLRAALRIVANLIYKVPLFLMLARRAVHLLPKSIYRRLERMISGEAGHPAISEPASRAVSENAEWILRALDRQSENSPLQNASIQDRLERK